MASYSAYQVANWFLAWTEDEPEITITHLKMQKLLYYAQAHYLAKFNIPLFYNTIEAWKKGPVVPDVYHKYAFLSKKIFTETQKYPALRLDVDFDFNDFQYLDNQFLIQIWEHYGKFEADDLVMLTHLEKPWIENFYVSNEKKKIISHNSMIHSFTSFQNVA